MNTDTEILVPCAKCDVLLAEEFASPELKSLECTNCGEKNRHIEIKVFDQLGMIDQIKGAFHEHGIKHWTKSLYPAKSIMGKRTKCVRLSV